MKVLVTGAKGQLGAELVNLFSRNSIEVFGFGRDILDFTDLDQVKTILSEIKPDVVIHSGAYTKVDDAEEDKDTAFLVNAIGTRNIALVSQMIGAKLVYISTDYVFDGSGTEPYHEFLPTKPIGVYGESKLAGEEFVKNLHSSYFIVRTSWVYGKFGNNFVKTMLKIAETRNELKVVHDQIGSPTYTLDLAAFILDVIRTEKYGIYHTSNSGSCSWYEFAKAIFEEAKININVLPCTTEDFPRPAKRPAYSVFDHMAIRLNGFNEMRHWRSAVSDFISEEYKGKSI